MVKNCLAFLSVVAMVLFVQPVRADQLYTSGVALNATNARAGIESGSFVTDTFTLSSASNVTSIDLGLWATSTLGSPSSLTYYIRDAGGTVNLSNTATLNTLSSNIFGSGFSQFESEFLLNASLGAGTYYLTLTGGSSSGGGALGWGYNQNPPNNTLTSWFRTSLLTPTTLGSPNEPTESFIINGTTGSEPSTVPEPGTMALLGLGMAGLAIYGKRRKNSKA